MNTKLEQPLARPLPPAPDVPAAELQQRLTNIRREMERDRLDVIVLSDFKNISYFTDYRTLNWVYKARPVLAYITASDLVVVAALTETRTVEAKPRPFTPCYYHGYLAEAIAALADSLGKSAQRGLTIGIDYGSDMAGLGSLELLDALSALSCEHKVRSAVKPLWRVRLIKSEFEAELKRSAFQIADSAFDQSIAHAHLGMPEIELFRRMQAQMFLNGAETADPIAMLFSKGDFAYTRPASNRPLEAGHYLWTDFRATYGGYPADRNRTARAGEPAEWERKMYSQWREMTHAVCRSVRPGITCADVFANFKSMSTELNFGATYSGLSRIGHGGGLDVTEPPSIAPGDHEVIRAGMILHIEPKIERDGAMYQFEEVFYVREDGIDFLAPLSPENIPVIR